MKALPAPSPAIRLVCSIVFHYMINSANDGWDEVKNKLLGNTRLTEEMQTKDMGKITATQAKRAKDKMNALKKESDFKGKDFDELKEAIRKKSGPLMGLFVWCTATEECYEIFRDVEPKRRKAEEMTRKAEASEK